MVRVLETGGQRRLVKWGFVPPFRWYRHPFGNPSMRIPRPYRRDGAYRFPRFLKRREWKNSKPPISALGVIGLMIESEKSRAATCLPPMPRRRGRGNR